MTELPLADHVRAILARHHLVSDSLEQVAGFANAVFQTNDVVVRLNHGRFRNAFQHEAGVLRNLPGGIPHASVVAYGTWQRCGEYLVLERRPGKNAEQALGALRIDDRRLFGAQLGQAIRNLHAMPLQTWMHCVWAAEALAEERWRDAYHAPAEYASQLLRSARGQIAHTDDMLDRVENWLQLQLPHLEPAGQLMFVHTDLHMRNCMVQHGELSALIDFEGSRIGTLDMEQDMLIRSLREGQHSDLIAGLRETYPDILDVEPRIHRIQVNEAMWHVLQMHHWQPGETWTKNPLEALDYLIRGRFREEILNLLKGS